MFIIEKPGLEKQQLVAEITAYYTAKMLDLKTNNVSIEFAKLGEEEFANVSHLDDIHLISVNENNGVTKIIESVSHELRHVWQANNGWKFDYSLPYREQEHEKDAWKFMHEFTSKYKDAIYQDYLKLRPTITNEPIKKPTKKESTKMTKQFTVQQLNKAGLVASNDIRSIVAAAGIKTIKNLKVLREELELDNRGTVRINFNNVETFAYLLADKIIKGQIEGFTTTANMSHDALTKVLVDYQTEQLKAGKYLLDVDSFVIYLTEEKLNALIGLAVKITGRHESNSAALLNHVKSKGYEGEDAKKIIRHVNAHHAKEMREKNLTNIITGELDKFIDEAVEHLFPVVEEVVAEEVIETPAADESPVAEETKEEKDEVIVEQNVITVEEHNAVLERIKEQFTTMQDLYEQTIDKLTELNKAQAVEIEKLASEQSTDVDDLRIELEKTKAELQTVASLRKADARRIEKLTTEMGRAKLQLREHKARTVSNKVVTELPEDAVSKTVHARIVTAGKIDGTAQSIHEKAPEKIANAAEKTKDGIQWVADKAKGSVDLTARGTNFASEQLANAMTYVADKIAPSTETVVESIIKVKNGEQVATIGGVEYKLDDKGNLIF